MILTTYAVTNKKIKVLIISIKWSAWVFKIKAYINSCGALETLFC